MTIIWLFPLISHGSETKWDLAGEVSALVENGDSTADENETVQQPGTAFYSTIMLRGENRLHENHTDSFYIKLREPFSARRRNDRFAHIEWKSQRGARELQLGNFTPRFHEWTIQHKRITGLKLHHQSTSRNWELFAGKEKRLPYNLWESRRVSGVRFEKSIGSDSVFQSEFVSTQEDGADDRKRNNLWLGRIQFGKNSGNHAGVTFARSLGSRAGNALRIQGQWRRGQPRVQAELEDIDSDFETLAGYTHAGRQLFVTRVLMPVGPHASITTGFVRNRLPSHEIVSIPLTIQVKPISDTPLVIQADYNSQNNKLPDGNTFNRTAGLSLQNTLGPVVMQVGFLSDSYSSGESHRRTAFMDVNYKLNDKVSMRSRAQREIFKQEALPRHMYYFAMNIDLAEWTALSLTGEIRDRIGQNRSRVITGSSLRFLNPQSEMELIVDYKHINYGDHNEKHITAEITNSF